MTQMTIQQAFGVAAQHHQAGRMREAEIMLRQILAQQPNHVDALNLLGVMAAQAGRFDIAMDLIRKALALNPNMPVAQSNLGNLLSDTGDQDAAIAAYRKALALDPNYAEAHYNLGNSLRTKGDMDAAIAAFERAIALKPNLAEAYSNLGITTLWEKGQMDAAVAACQKAIALKPNFPAAYSNLGCALKKQGKTDEAIAAYQKAITLNPRYTPAYCNLGTALWEKRLPDQAIAVYRQVLTINPNHAEAHSGLGIALAGIGNLDGAIAEYRHAISLKHTLADAHFGLGNALKDQGKLDEALAEYHQAIAIKPGYAEAHSNLILAMQYHGGSDAPTIADELRRWNRQHAEPLRQFIRPHANDRNPDRRLRIGYISPDFREHPVARFFMPLLENHDRQNFEIFCYSQVELPDAMTQHVQAKAEHWRSLVDVSDEQADELIRRDGIDILVDLALHTAHHRLLLFARKPAPVQVTYAGYPGSTGLTTIDYRLSDPYLDPPRKFDDCYSEQTIRLPHSFWCYHPREDREIPVNALPAGEIREGQAVGHVTFGCLNNFCKINSAVLRLWAKVMQAVPDSHLLLLTNEGGHRRETLQLLEQEGIDAARIEFAPRQEIPHYLRLYHRIDLALDSFPYNGHTTSLDSMWMGVPVVTLVGQTVVGRAGLCQLMNLNLPELIAQTPEQFVQIAVALAQDRARLAELRRTLRQRMEQSPLMNAVNYTRDIEAAYRQMWRKWAAASHGLNAKCQMPNAE